MPDPTPAATTTTDASPNSVTTTTTVKPGWTTSEHAITVLVAFLGAFTTAGIVGDGSIYLRVAGMVLVALTTLGYQQSRASVKKAASQS